MIPTQKGAAAGVGSPKIFISQLTCASLSALETIPMDATRDRGASWRTPSVGVVVADIGTKG